MSRGFKKLEEILDKGGSDMEVYQTKAHKFYPPAIKLRKLMDRIDPEWAGKLNAGTDLLKLSVDEMKRAMTEWLSDDITDGEYVDLLKQLGIDGRPVNKYSSRQKMLKALSLDASTDGGGSGGKGDKTTKMASLHVERLMQPAFGVKFLPSSTKERGHRTLDFSPYTRLVKYKAAFGAFAFVDDPDSKYDPLDDPLEPGGASQSD